MNDGYASRMLEWNPKDNVVLLLTCQEEQEWMEMLQDPAVMKERIETKRKGRV